MQVVVTMSMQSVYMYKVNDVTNWLPQTTDNSKYFVCPLDFELQRVACRYIEHVREEVSCQKKCFWLNNLAILYGLCILDISFLH